MTWIIKNNCKFLLYIDGSNIELASGGEFKRTVKIFDTVFILSKDGFIEAINEYNELKSVTSIGKLTYTIENLHSDYIVITVSEKE